jgi:hypothetical protein
MPGKDQWVSPRDNGKWGVHGAGNTRDTNQYDTQAQAIQRAKEIATNQHREVIVQGQNGRIRSKEAMAMTHARPKTKSINLWAEV